MLFAEQGLSPDPHAEYVTTVTPGPDGEIFNAADGTWKVHIGGDNRTCNLGTFPLQMRYFNSQTLRYALVDGAIYSDIINMEEDDFCITSVGLLVRDSAGNSTIDGVRINGAWDAIRITGVGTDNFSIKNTWVSNNRSRCFQNLSGMNGEISDSLFDNCFNGLYVGGSDNSSPNNIVSIDKTLLKVSAYPSTEFVLGDGSGNVLFGSSTAPRLNITNSVFAYDTDAVIGGLGAMINFLGQSSSRLEHCQNNQMLWLMNDDTPSEMNTLDPCFELISGLHAQKEWEKKRCIWINNHPVPGLVSELDKTRRLASDEITCDVNSIADLIVLNNGDYNVDDAANPEGIQFRRYDDNKVYDASNTRFHLNNCSVADPDAYLGTRGVNGCAELFTEVNHPDRLPITRYPIALMGEHNTIVRPFVDGKVPQHALWHLSYVNSAGILIGNESQNSKIYGARINDSWDAIRVTADDFIISDVYSTGSRDDCIENDNSKGGKIIDSLFDECNFGLSMRASSDIPNAEDNSKVIIDGLLLRLTEHRELKRVDDPSSEITGLRQPFKVRANSASIEIHNSIFAYDGKTVIGPNQMRTMLVPDEELGIDKLKACSNNKILWMDSDDLPEHLTEFEIPDCFDIVTGIDARNMWEQLRCDWLNRHPSHITRRMDNEFESCVLPVIESISASTSSLVLGESVDLAITVADFDTEGYNDEDILWFSSRDGQLDIQGLSGSVDTLSIGTHTIRASITNIDGAKDHKAITINVSAPDVSMTLHSDVLSPVSIGTTIHLNSEISGDSVDLYHYKFEIKTNDNPQTWQLLQEYSLTNILSIDTHLFPGENQIRVTARHIQDNNLQLTSKIRVWVNSENALTQFDIEPAYNIITEENSLLLKGIIDGASANNYEYKFEVKNAQTKEKTLLADFSSNNEYLWDTSSILGKYRVLIYAKIANTNDLPAKESTVIWRNESNAVTEASLSILGNKTVNAGEFIELIASVISGGSDNPIFEFRYKEEGSKEWQLIQEWSNNSTTVWDTVGLSGTFTLMVLIKNGGSLDRPVKAKVRNVTIN